jgi:hypothetical protein
MLRKFIKSLNRIRESNLEIILIIIIFIFYPHILKKEISTFILYYNRILINNYF